MTIIICVLACLLFVPAAVLFVECLAAVLWRQPTTALSTTRPSAAIVIPAHNEAAVIFPTLRCLMQQIGPQDRVLVVADNCNDQTAEISRQVGATVIERVDPVRRGKGYALDHAIRWLETDPPDIVIVVDADSDLGPGAVDALARTAASRNAPVQAVYLLRAPANPSMRDMISSFAFMVRNLVRPLGLRVLGMPCLLTGTGMAFPWSQIRGAMLASGNIVEDMQLALDLAIAGHPAMLCTEAKVNGCLPGLRASATKQRKRWEHGHLQTMLTQTPRLMMLAMRQRRLDLLALALDLSVPPLSLLVLMWGVVFSLTVIAGLLGASWFPGMLTLIGGAMILAAIFVAWAGFGRDSLPLTSFLVAPLYVLWKIPLYLSFLFRREKAWIRTDRETRL